MANLRFRKSLKIAPGVKLNINKNSVGVTFGPKGAHYSINSKGRRTKSVGIPGTGLSAYETTSGKAVKVRKKSSNGQKDDMYNLPNQQKLSPNDYQSQPQDPFYKKLWFIVLMLFVFAPIGLYLMWAYTDWKTWVKIVASLIAIPIFMGIASGAFSEDSFREDKRLPERRTAAADRMAAAV